MNKILSIGVIFFTALLFAILPIHSASADPADISATSRSVVRVVLAARDGNKVVFVGHGSGFAVAPDKILTNAHVVELARTEPSIVLGVIPSQGTKSYGGRIIAYSPGNDLALLQIQDGGKLPPTTIFGGPIADGSNVVAIGYPASVDRAQGLNLDDMIRPLSPVKSRGSTSAGRSTKQFDTVLHTAAIAGGNSGGPLVDSCGRILGVNSFGSLANGSDAEFGFAVSNREVLSFLRKAGVKANLTTTDCRSTADIKREELAREQEERKAQERAEKAEETKQAQAQQKWRAAATQEIIAERENSIAIAALMLVAALVAAGAAGILFMRSSNNLAIAAGLLAVLLIAAAIIIFISRPSFNEVEDRIAAAKEKASGTADPQNTQTATPGNGSGHYQCTLNPKRSRITVSQNQDVNLSWTDAGCVNGRTQYGRDGAKWSRIFVPNEEQTVTISSFAPDRQEYSTERYLLGLEAMTRARAIRAKYNIKSCTASADILAQVEDMQKALRAELPNGANERLIYECQKGEDE